MTPKRFKHTTRYLGIFTVVLMMTSCGSSGGDAVLASETSSIPTKAPVLTPTIIPTPTFNPEVQNAVVVFNSEELGFHNLYKLNFGILEDGQITAQSLYDQPGDPHFTFDVEADQWIDNHPGRNEMDSMLPKTTTKGRNILFEFQGLEWDAENEKYLTELNPANVAVWDQEHLAYRYTNTDTDPGHDQFFLSRMAVKYGLKPVNEEDMIQGRSNFCESFETDDYEKGVSGVKLDFYISDAHPYVKWWTNQPEAVADLANQLISEMYLGNFPWLKGKQVIVRMVAKDYTSKTDLGRIARDQNEDLFFHDDGTDIIDGWITGLSPEVAPDTHLITLSLSNKEYEDDNETNDYAFATGSNLATLWALQVHEDSNITIEDDYLTRAQGMFFPQREVELEEPGIESINDLADWKLKN